MAASSTSRPEKTCLVLVLSLALSAWSAVLLAEVGRLKPALFVAAAIAWGALAIVGRRRTSAFGRSPDPAIGAMLAEKQGLAAAGVLVFCAAIFFPPYETFVWASDSSVYMGLGAEVARNDGYEFRDPLLAEIAVPARVEIFRNPAVLDATGTYVRLPGGFGIRDIEEPTVVAGFSPVFPAILAVVYDFLGVQAMPWLAPTFATLSMVALLLLGARVGGTVAGVGSAALAAVAMPQIWFAKFSMPEIVAELFVIGALLALSISLTGNQPHLGGLAGGLLGIAALSKFELLPIVTITLMAFVGAVLLWTGRRPKLVYLWMAGSYAVLLAHAAAHYLLLPTHYTLFIQQEISANYVARAIRRFGGGQSVLVIALVGIAASIVLSRVGDGLRSNLDRPRWWGAALLLTVAAYFANGSGAPDALSSSAGLTAGLGETIGWLQWYLSWPFGAILVVAAAAAGVSWLQRRAATRTPSNTDERPRVAAASAAGSTELLAFVAVLVLVACMHLYRSPDTDEHIWAMRRFVPVVLPGLALLTATLTVVALRRLYPRRGPVAAAIILAVLTAIVATPSLAIVGQPLWEGSLHAGDDIAALLPPGSVVLMSVDLAGTHLATALNYIHEVQTIVLRPTMPTPELLGELVAAWIDAGRPVFVFVGERAFSFYAPDLSLAEVDRRVLAVRVLERTRDRPPRHVITNQTPLTIARLFPRGRTATAIDVGNLADDAFYQLSGFHGPEQDGGRPEATFRWTTGSAKFLIPPVSSVRLTLSGGRPDGLPPARVSVSVDGEFAVEDFEISNEPMEIVVDIPTAQVPAMLADGRSSDRPSLSTTPRSLVLLSTTFRPAQAGGSTDERQLGVKLYRVELIGSGIRPGEGGR